MQTVPFHALIMTFYWTNAHSARIPSMEIGVTRNAPTSVNHVIYGMAHVMIVNTLGVRITCFSQGKNLEFLFRKTILTPYCLKKTKKIIN